MLTLQRKYKKYRKNRVTTSTEEPDSKEIQGDDEFKILDADEKAEEAAIEDKLKQDEVEVPVEPSDEIIDNRVPIIGITNRNSYSIAF